MNDNQTLAEFFKLFSNKNRLDIILALKAQPLSVNDISQRCQLSQSLVSQQLKLLKTARIVTSERQGKTITYSLFDRHILHLIKDVSEHLLETSATPAQARTQEVENENPL